MSIAGTNAITELWAKCKAYFQAKLVSGTNIKTINNESLLGSGNISVGGGGSDVTGVKGDSESTYRTGNVNLTAANIGAAAADHKHVFIYEDLIANPLHRLYVTGSNNIRVDARADANSGWGFHSYAA